MAKPQVNFWVDAAIGAAFTVSAVSGLVFLLPVDGGTATGVLGLSYRTWDQIHLWSSLTTITGVITHLVLHAKWITVTTRRVLGISRRPAGRAAPSGGMPRRRFLHLAGVALASFVVGAVSGALATTSGRQADAADASASDPALSAGAGVDQARADPPSLPAADATATPPAPSTTAVAVGTAGPADGTATATVAPSQTPCATPTGEVAMCVKCPRGLVNDPYPGRCRLYVDRNGNGICDNSEPFPCD